MKRTTGLPFLILFSALAARPMTAATTVADFETHDERARAPRQRNGSVELGCVRESSLSGEWAFRFRALPWKEGMPQWPSFTITPSVSDWRGFDRLSIDMICSSPKPGQQIFAYFSSPTGRVQTGLYAGGFVIPADGVARWTVPLDVWPKTASPASVGKMHFFMTRPAVGAEILFDRFRLLKKGEPADPPGDRVGAVIAAEKRKRRSKADISHLRAIDVWREACEAEGCGGTLLLGTASSMENVRPRGGKAPQAVGGRGISVRLARGEREAVQLLVTDCRRDLAEVRVSPAGDFRRNDGSAVFSASNIACRVVGYVEVREPPPYETRAGEDLTGWWPDPILEYLDHAPVKAGDFQSFWIRVSCPAGQLPGVYRGKILVDADGIRREVPLSVRVNRFEVSPKDFLPLAVSFMPTPSLQMASTGDEANARKIRADPAAPCNLWRRHVGRWGEFLADYGITLDALYHAWDPSPYPYWDILRKLDREGRLGFFNLGYWHVPADDSDASLEAWRKSVLPRIRRRYEAAKAAGLLKRAYIYGCDELPRERFSAMVRAVSELKREFPDVPVSTTAYDHDYGVGSPLSDIDWFTPLTSRYDMRKAEAARKEGRKVWWYVCNEPRLPYANFLIECPVIESRLLTGAQAVRMRSDGLLYYQAGMWNASRPIDGASAFTGWPARSWTNINGDGCLVCCGPGGSPMPTLRLENFRDGLEDHAYAVMLRRAAAAAPGTRWADAAGRLADVPGEVMTSMSDFSTDPRALYRWRDRMADILDRIEEKKGVQP